MANQFYSDMLPYAKLSASLTGMSVEVILSQWALESNYGQSDLARRGKNLAGIKSSSLGKDFTTGMYAGYHSFDSFARDYARVMKLSFYDKVREATNVKDEITELDKSPWAEDTDYANKLAGKLKELTGLNLDFSGIVTNEDGKINFVGWALGCFGVWWLLFR